MTAGEIHPGDRVRCEQSTASLRTWKRYAGRVGTVIQVRDGEVGVSWRPTADNHPAVDAWFLPSELVKVAQRLPVPPGRPEAAPDGPSPPDRVAPHSERTP